jgi:hypothetical protein
MGDPVLPDGMPSELLRGIEQCLANRPADTTPPAPGSK